MSVRELKGKELDDFILAHFNSRRSVADLADMSGTDPDDYLFRYTEMVTEGLIPEKLWAIQCTENQVLQKQNRSSSSRKVNFMTFPRSFVESVVKDSEEGFSRKQLSVKYNISATVIAGILKNPEKRIDSEKMTRPDLEKLREEAEAWDPTIYVDINSRICITDEDHDFLSTLKEAGFSYYAIAEFMGVSYNSVYNLLKYREERTADVNEMRIARKRDNRGVVFSQKEVNEILKMRNEGSTYGEIAYKYNAGITTIFKICQKHGR